MKKETNHVACCPNCGTGLSEELICPVCDGKVYSHFYAEYINLNDAIYSRTHQDYFLEKDVCYSQYYDDYILKDRAVKVYNLATDEEDYVPKDKVVYSDYYKKHLIFAQTVFSFYYDTYLYADPERTAYSKYLDSYIDIGDDDIAETEDDYVPKKTLLV